MTVQIEIFECTGIMGQDLVHSYIQSTTVLCDIHGLSELTDQVDHRDCEALHGRSSFMLGVFHFLNYHSQHLNLYAAMLSCVLTLVIGV